MTVGGCLTGIRRQASDASQTQPTDPRRLLYRQVQPHEQPRGKRRQRRQQLATAAEKCENASLATNPIAGQWDGEVGLFAQRCYNFDPWVIIFSSFFFNLSKLSHHTNEPHILQTPPRPAAWAGLRAAS